MDEIFYRRTFFPPLILDMLFVDKTFWKLFANLKLKWISKNLDSTKEIINNPRIFLNTLSSGFDNINKGKKE
ncbi:hypothetical protein LEP1GSC170_4366 [Leptospira interrogans serovar Bataviae str. HAI135]|nr:hypothetical protein LEP1GSC170_4366 [Leptospira interrogans serovar Bataviae str. HAI135]